MGALDWFEAKATCPSCGREQLYSGQTSFFAPDFAGSFHRTFAVGARQRIDFAPDLLESARVWDGEWFRVRERGRAGHVSVLVDFDELVGCVCGVPFAIALELALEPIGTATLEGLTLLDARSDEVARSVDWANIERVDATLPQLEAAPESERAARLSAALRAHFGPWLERFGRS